MSAQVVFRNLRQPKRCFSLKVFRQGRLRNITRRKNRTGAALAAFSKIQLHDCATSFNRPTSSSISCLVFNSVTHHSRSPSGRGYPPRIPVAPVGTTFLKIQAGRDKFMKKAGLIFKFKTFDGGNLCCGIMRFRATLLRGFTHPFRPHCAHVNSCRQGTERFVGTDITGSFFPPDMLFPCL